MSRRETVIADVLAHQRTSLQLLIALLCLLCGGPAAAQNVVANPGFESGTNGWVRRFGGTLTNSSPGHFGTNAARVFNRSGASQGVQQSLLGILQDGTLYSGSTWVYTSSDTNVTVNFSVQQDDGRGARTTQIASGQISNAWTQLTGTFGLNVNGTLTNLNLYVSGPPTGVDLFVDDVSLTPFVFTAPENLLSNPGFESSLTGWATHGPVTLLSSMDTHTGTNCVAVTHRAAAWNGVEQNLVGKMQIGRPYFVSAWIRTDRPTNDLVKLTFQRNEPAMTDYTLVASGQVSSNGWTWLSGYYTPQTTGTVTALKFFVEGPPAGVTLFVDDAYVAPATGLRKATANYPNVRLGSGGVSRSELQAGAPLFGVFADAFHLCSPGNALKFQPTQPESNLWTFAEANALLDFGQAHGGSSRGHVFVWHNSVPGWITNVSRTPDELRGILWNQIDTVATKYRDRLPYWDVVNEAMNSAGTLRSTLWYDSPGIGYAANGDQYIAEAFQRARANDADATLIYNDYSIETVNSKSDGVYNMLSNFVATGVPVDGLGIQAHLSGTNFDAASFRSNLQRFHDLGLNLHITELDVRLPVDANGFANAADLAGQAEVYFDFLGTALGYSSLKVFQTWGIYDGDSWIPGKHPGYGQALPFDFNLDKKPAYWAMWNALNGQAEKLPVLAISSSDASSVVSNSLLSASSSRRLHANAANDFITLEVEVPFKGQWSVKVGALKANNTGRFQLAIAPPGDPNFVNVGGVTDTYAASSAAAEFDLGTDTFGAAGDWQFRFTVPSKNGSSSDYDLTLDYIRLTPVACEPLVTWLPANQSVPLNIALSPTLFLAEDDLAAGSLVVTATSSDPSLVPDTNLVITGGSPYYTIAATPLSNRAGEAVISLIASDGTNSATNSFTLTVGTPQEAWRTFHFDTALNTGDAADSADPDRDNRGNLEEYVAGTNPKFADMPPLLGITQAAGQVMVSFTATAASGPGYSGLTRRFDLLSTTNVLPSSDWPGVPGCTNVAGSNQLVIHTNTPDAEGAFYQLQIRLP